MLTMLLGLLLVEVLALRYVTLGAVLMQDGHLLCLPRVSRQGDQ